MKKLNEVITFKFYTKEEAQSFYVRRMKNFRNTESELNIYEVVGKGWVVEVAV